MKFTSVLLSGIFTSATVLAEFGLEVESFDLNINEKKLAGYHEGAGINFLFLVDNAEQFSYNLTTEAIYNLPTPQDLQTFSIFQDVAMIGILGTTPVTFDNEYLQINGSSDGFYACKNLTYDPYNYSKDLYALLYKPSENLDECISVKVKKSI